MTENFDTLAYLLLSIHSQENKKKRLKKKDLSFPNKLFWERCKYKNKQTNHVDNQHNIMAIHKSQ